MNKIPKSEFALLKRYLADKGDLEHPNWTNILRGLQREQPEIVKAWDDMKASRAVLMDLLDKAEEKAPGNSR